MATKAPLVVLETKAGVATITLDSAHNRNAMSRALMVELAAALDHTQQDLRVRIVVLTGVDPVFCAGADLKEQADGQGPGPVGLPVIADLIMNHRCPVIARVNGPARAGGLGLMAVCDIAIGLTTATFGFSEVRIGVVPAIIAVPVLARMNATAAHQYFLTGEVFDGHRAAETGLLNCAVAPDELDSTVARYTDMLLCGGPQALAATKQLTRIVPGRPIQEMLAQMQVLSTSHFSSEEGQEGIAASREKREPRWMSVSDRD